VTVIAVLVEELVVDPEQPFDLPESPAWDALGERYPGLIARSHFEGRSRASLERIEARVREMDPFNTSPSLLSLVEVTIPACLVSRGLAVESVLEDLAALGVVAEAHVSLPPGPLAQIGLTTATRISDQTYLEAAPVGVDAAYAWTGPGEYGKGIDIVDIEWGWGDSHPDLPNLPLLAGNEVGEYSHGTSVAGVLVGRNDGKGIVGIVPDARVRTVASWSGSPVRWRPGVAISDACSALLSTPGAVLLLEEQVSSPLRPLEYDYVSRLAIGKATSAGIVVIEPSGNGGLFLDEWTFAGKYILQRGHPDFVDSGAIMVGACTNTQPLRPMTFSNYGSRVDCVAQGWGVVTTDVAPRYYTTQFSGTSSASAIIAGVAAAVQACVAKLTPARAPLTSRQMRWILETNGTALSSGNRVGPMPDLKKILTSRPWDSIPNPLVYD
jgi:hypothetical protein